MKHAYASNTPATAGPCRFGPLALGLIVGLGLTGCDDDDNELPDRPDGPPLAEAKLLIEHNATDQDTGFQIFVDGEPWNRLSVEGPRDGVVDIIGRGTMVDFGFTEGFFETNEPPADEVPFEDVLARFPEGDYPFAAISAEDGTIMRGVAVLSHNVPAAPEIVSPVEDELVDPASLVIDWNEVRESLTGTPITLVGYQVILELDEDLPASQSLFRSELNVFLPPETTSLTVPPEFLRPDTAYEVEVLALEESGNQTIGLVAFETGQEPR